MNEDTKVGASPKIWLVIALLAGALMFGMLSGCAADARGALKNDIIGSGSDKK